MGPSLHLDTIATTGIICINLAGWGKDTFNMATARLPAVWPKSVFPHIEVACVDHGIAVAVGGRQRLTQALGFAS
jgi:hypothetical protein